MNAPHATQSPDVSVLLVTWNAGDDIGACLETILRDKSAGSIEIILVDNDSSDCTIDVVRSFPEVRLFQTGGNLGFAPAMNIALKAARGRYLFLLNPDARLVNDAVGQLVSFLESHPDAGCASPQLLNSDGSVALWVTRQFPSVLNTVLRQFGLRRLFSQSTWMGREYLPGWDRQSPRNVPCLSGAALMIPRSVYLEVGFLDTVLPMYFEDLDYCKRIADTGRLLYYVPGACVMHVGGKSASASTAKRLLSSMQDGEAVWLFLRRYRGGAHAAAFRVVIAVGSLFRLIAIYLLRFLPIGLPPSAPAAAAQHARNSSALLQWALVPRPIFYGWINKHFTRSQECRSTTSKDAGKRVPVSVSIIIHNINRASALERCLKSVAAQIHRPIEVVLMDAGSTDGSDEVIAVATADLVSKGIAVRSEKCPLMGVARSRNYAAKRASGRLLCFLDNDAAFEDARCISRVVRAFESAKLLGVLSFRSYMADSGEPDPTGWVFRRPRAKWFTRRFETFTFTGGGFCVRADAFNACGGFWDHLKYAREEEELAMALIHTGWRIAYSPDVSIRHYSDLRGRDSMAQRRCIELRNGLLVLWRRLPAPIALPMMAVRISSMVARALLREHQPLAKLLRAIPDAVWEWKAHSLQRCPISVQSAIKYAGLHRIGRQ